MLSVMLRGKISIFAKYVTIARGHEEQGGGRPIRTDSETTRVTFFVKALLMLQFPNNNQNAKKNFKVCNNKICLNLSKPRKQEALQMNL